MGDKYPLQLLPRDNYSQSIDLGMLLDVYPSLKVSRRIDGNKRELVIIDNGIKVLADRAYFGSVARLSVNLSGAKFKARRHIMYRPTDKSILCSWDGDSFVTDLRGKFEIKSPCFPVYYRVRDFLDFPVRQEMTFNHQKEFDGFVSTLPANKKENKYLQQFNKGEKLYFDVKKTVNHMPTICNYWHIEFNVFSYDDDDNPIDTGVSSSSCRRILSHLKSDYLTKQVSFFHIAIPILPCFYKKGRKNQIIRDIIHRISIFIQATAETLGFIKTNKTLG